MFFLSLHQDRPSEDDKHFTLQHWRTTRLLPPPTGSCDQSQWGRGCSYHPCSGKRSKELRLQVAEASFENHAFRIQPRRTKNLSSHFFFYFTWASPACWSQFGECCLTVNVSRAAKQADHLARSDAASRSQLLTFLHSVPRQGTLQKVFKRKKTEGFRGIPHCWCLHHHIGKCTCKNTMRLCKAVADHK